MDTSKNTAKETENKGGSLILSIHVSLPSIMFALSNFDKRITRDEHWQSPR